MYNRLYCNTVKSMGITIKKLQYSSKELTFIDETINNYCLDELKRFTCCIAKTLYREVYYLDKSLDAINKLDCIPSNTPITVTLSTTILLLNMVAVAINTLACSLSNDRQINYTVVRQMILAYTRQVVLITNNVSQILLSLIAFECGECCK